MGAAMQGTGGEYPASSTSASEGANETSISKRGPGGYFHWQASRLPIPCLMMGSHSVHTGNRPAPGRESRFRKQTGGCIAHVTSVWRSFGCVRVPHRTIRSRRDVPRDRLARVLWDRDIAPHHGILLSYAHAELDPVGLSHIDFVPHVLTVAFQVS